MNRIALLHLAKHTTKQYNSKIILNPNIAVYGNNCKFNGKLFNPSNVYFMDYTDEFMKTNLTKLMAPHMYFTKMFVDCDIYLKLQHILNSNLNTNIYVNERQYDKFIRRMEISIKYMTGDSYDNSTQVFPFDFKNTRFIHEEVVMGDKSYTVYKNSL